MTEPTLLETWMRPVQERTEQALDYWLPAANTHPGRLHEAMRYAVLGGGKRIRPVLVHATGAALGVSPKPLDGAACALELIHAYSLVHDDLPCMDDDDMRRGKPTVHKAYDEATAVLVGDALQSLAFFILAHDGHIQVEPAARLQMIEILARAAGSRGMVGGQAIDLASEGKQLDIAALEDLHIHKTGALIRASVNLAVLSSPVTDHALHEQLDRYAKCIGLAFQIRDDILDVEGDTATLGKPRGSDEAHNKATYPALLGLAGAKERAKELLDEALAALSALDHRADPLRWIARYIVERIN